MRVWVGSIARLPIFLGLVLAGDSFEAAAQNQEKPGTSPSPLISPATRESALQKVAKSLDDSPGMLQQPAALVRFFEQIYELSAGHNPTPVHILHFGDSHTAADEWTGELRHLFKKGFGDGGAGFSLPGHPFPGYRRFDAPGGGSSGWRTEGLHSVPGDGLFGLGGISISTERAGQSVFIETECDRLEIHYLQQPDGGDVALYDNDERIEEFSTNGELKPSFITYPVSSGVHRFTLKTLNSHPVRLFGWVADKETGVTYEALGINGAQARVILGWNEDMLATYLRRRNPALVVLAYGTNESTDATWNVEKYRTMFSELVQRLRRAIPVASILVVGPPDGYLRRRGKWQLLAEVDDVIEAQQDACLENDCAFWDTRERMGGKGSMRDWVLAGLAQTDYIHFTPSGYRRLAGALFADLMQQYETYKRVRKQISEPVSDGHANENR